MRNFNRLLIFIIYIFFFCIPSTNVEAIFILDQEYFVEPPVRLYSYLGGDRSRVQTFTVGLDGTLAQIDVQLSRLSYTNRELYFELLSTNNGVPDSISVLASLEILPQNVPLDPTYTSFLELDLSPFALNVSSGDILAIHLSSRASYVWSAEDPGFYHHGNGYYKLFASGTFSPSFNDLGFKTYMETHPIPEPATFLLLGSGLLGTLIRRKRSKLLAGQLGLRTEFLILRKYISPQRPDAGSASVSI